VLSRKLIPATLVLAACNCGTRSISSITCVADPRMSTGAPLERIDPLRSTTVAA
jgi:hypothetical protein